MDKRAMYEQHKKPIAEANGHICACKAVSEETIVNAVKNGANSFEAVKEHTNAGSGCSLCEPIVTDIIAG